MGESTQYECQFCGAMHERGNICPSLKDLFVNSRPTVSTPTSSSLPGQKAGSNAMNNIGAGVDTPMCVLHKMPMDRVTKKGTPYHSYKGKNCSGEGWWGEKPQSTFP
jgi:hypothetical protein